MAENEDGLNRTLLVYNFLTQSWDGVWELGGGGGVVEFDRLTVNGQTRLCMACTDGQVRFFVEEDLTDAAESIEWMARTRGYRGGTHGRKHWRQAEAALDTWYSEYN